MADSPENNSGPTEDPTERPADMDNIGMDPDRDAATERLSADVGVSAVEETVPSTSDPTTTSTDERAEQTPSADTLEISGKKVEEAADEESEIEAQKVIDRAQNPQGVKRLTPDPNRYNESVRSQLNVKEGNQSS
jgi:hypothetical protein